MDQSRPNMGLRLAGVAFFCALALTACGGGGDTPPPPDNSSLPSNTGGGSGTGSGGSSNNNASTTSTTQGLFRVAETSQISGAGTARQLVVVNTRDQTAVRKFDLPANSTGASDWYVTDAYTAAPDGASAHIDGASQLYIVQNGRVLRLDLSGSAVGTAQTVSNVKDACGFARTGFIELALDGKQSWLEVATAGPDGKCELTNDNGVMLVSSNMDATEAGFQGGSNGLDLIETLQDSIAAPVTGILALDRSTAQLGVYSKDLKTRLYLVEVKDHAIQKAERAQSIGHLPSAPFQALIQLGSSLYMSGTSNGQLVLGAPLLQLTTPQNYPDSTTDSQNVYLVNGMDVVVISSTGSKTLATLSAGAGEVKGIWTSRSSVLVQQGQNMAQGDVRGTLTSLSKANGAATVLAQGPSSDDAQVVGVVDDTVFFRRAGTNTNAPWLSDILQTTAQGGTPNPVVSGVFISAYMWSPQLRLGSIDVLQAVWCQPLPNAITCSNGPLVSYNLNTREKITLGTVPLDAGWSDVLAYQTGEPFAQRTNVMAVSRYGESGRDEVLWTYNADVANSFTRVTTP